MTRKRLQHLSEGYLEGTLSPLEWNELKTYLLSDDNHHEFESVLMVALQQKEYENADRAILERILKNVFAAPHVTVLPTPAHRVHFLKTAWFRYAAAVIIIVGLSAIAYWWVTNKKADQTLVNNQRHLKTDVAPGGEKAVLTLANGTKIILDSAANGNLAQQGNARVVKLANGQVVYNVKGLSGKDIMWNTLSTPAGGQYQVTLPDGTRVWLNAASSITYPAAFVVKNRQVKITGEVYFEVAKNKERPFIVDIDGKSTVEVLGTKFNINSYNNEENIKTTLLEGSVKVSSVILKPGQQAVQARNDKIQLQAANVDQALAWKNGLFSFTDADLPAVMRQLERWYDIRVQYEREISGIRLKGKMYRNVNLSDVLEFLQTMGVQFRMEGKTVIIL